MYRARGPTSVRMPSDFPTAVYRSVYDLVAARAVADKYPDEWMQQFTGSALALAYRFRACARHDEAFARSILAAGRTPDEYDRFTQEEALFGFFVTGFASLESIYYFLYAIASRLAPSDFPFAGDPDYRNIDLPKTAKRFKHALPGKLADELLRVQSSPDREGWEYARNVLIHRIASGRTVYLWTQPPTHPDDIRLGSQTIPLTVQAMKVRRAWLAVSLTGILTQANLFVSQNF